MITRRDLTFCVVGLVLGGCLGYAGHAFVRPARPERPERAERPGKRGNERRERNVQSAEAEAREPAMRLGPPSQPDDAPAAGSPLVWKDSAPESVLPAGFEPNARAAVDACFDAPKIVAMECDEPPCFLLVDMPGEAAALTEQLTACDTWSSVYTEQPLVWRLTRTCDGVEKAIVAIGARDSFEHVASESGRLAKPKGRLQWRASALRDEYLCDG